MSYIIPEQTTRLNASVFVNNAELSAVGRDQIFRLAAQNLAETALRKLIDDCIRTDEHQGFKGQTLRLDVYVIEPSELHKMLAEARQQGEMDAMRWRL